MSAIDAPSPLRGPTFRIRVYPPLRSALRGPMSENSLWTTSRSGTTLSTCRRAWTPPSLANVISFSASGRSVFALASVVVIRSWLNRDAASPLNRSFWWAGPPPSRWPFLGVGTSASSVLAQRQPEVLELRLDLVDRLLSEVADVHELLLGLLDQVGHGVHGLALQAVVR